MPCKQPQLRFYFLALRSIASIFAITTSEETNLFSPASIAAMRIAISASQAALTFSRGVALTHGQSAKSALSSGENFMAFDLSCSIVIDMRVFS